VTETDGEFILPQQHPQDPEVHQATPPESTCPPKSRASTFQQFNSSELAVPGAGSLVDDSFICLRRAQAEK
jgi:hypothetical protein